MEQLNSKIDRAVAGGQLMKSAARNIRALLAGAPSDLYLRVVGELVNAGEWYELNDRFYQTLSFGTGGLRGRTIGKIVTRAERGNAREDDRPEFPCVGTNAMNFFNISRATRGLVAYLHDWNAREKISAKPKLVIAHDPRFFSKEFAELAAKVAAESGCDAFIFDGPRSVPELSFAVRYLKASAGVVITASHNPPYDNGYKVYFSDGSQVIEPQASGIIAKVNEITAETFTALPKSRQGRVTTIGEDVDDAYMQRLETLILDPQVIGEAKSLRIIYTPLHGTGSVIIKPMLKRLGFNFTVVSQQKHFDGQFPTVKSPNPENAEALTMAIELAEKANADLVVATDPDCDRMGAAIRAKDGRIKLLTGNQIGSLLAWYRIKTLFDQGVLNKKNASRAVIIKTFVTTDLQKAIAEHYGLRCVETLTGFKYIGAKLGKYEREIPEQLRQNYVDLSEDETRRLRLEHSSFYVFGGEESYGYSGADFVRDKDGNGAVIMFCEVAAYAKSRGQTIDELLDEIFGTFGYFAEKNSSLVFEGAEGANKIARLAESYATEPFSEILGVKVTSVKNFETDTIKDVEGDKIPKEKMSIFELEDGTRIAVRPSGTEPKIKYYLFAQHRPKKGTFSSAELEQIKAEVGGRLDWLWDWLQKDARARLNKSRA
ncbi:MAG: phosphomannomutase [Verrucomicrobia bacterium]|nr:MAG: phosphomannomutase [Verrucomicrobiota bacterium]PYK33229.1 MAG: phosphomannomutase [Verrucomicrobiota bacterium]